MSCMIFWERFESWKTIPSDELDATNQAFVLQYGSDPIPLGVPNNNGWRVYQNSSSSETFAQKLLT